MLERVAAVMPVSQYVPLMGLPFLCHYESKFLGHSRNRGMGVHDLKQKRFSVKQIVTVLKHAEQ